MLKDATGFKKIYIAAGKTDLRKGMDSLAAIVSLQFELDPYETDILFLFCGSNRRLIKGLVWEEDGFVLLSKRLQNGVFQWPRDRQEVMDLTQKQFSDLMNGLSIVSTIRIAQPKYLCGKIWKNVKFSATPDLFCFAETLPTTNVCIPREPLL